MEENLLNAAKDLRLGQKFMFRKDNNIKCPS